MAWIESHQTLSKHKKTLRAAGLLKCDKHKLIGHLHELWWWGLDNVTSYDGDLGDLSDYEIALAAEWDGDPTEFVQAITEAGFIDEENGGRYLHDWYDYAGKLIERREANAERMRQRRAEKRARKRAPNGSKEHTDERADNVQRTCSRTTQPTVPNPTKPEEDDRARTREGFAPRVRGWEAWYHHTTATTVPSLYAIKLREYQDRTDLSNALITTVFRYAHEQKKRNLPKWVLHVLPDLYSQGIRSPAEALAWLNGPRGSPKAEVATEPSNYDERYPVLKPVGDGA